MKFSVLLPTRNRLDLLTYAIETVRRQDYQDWEVIVSDNCSADDIGGYIRSLNDTRIVWSRSDTPLAVTANWNRALEMSSGDYVVMLGDDDGLMPGYFSSLLRAMETHASPDFVYVGGLYFAYPGVLPMEPEGYLRFDRNKYFTSKEAYWLDGATAFEIGRKYLDFRMPVASNMQYSLISRGKIEEFSRSGPFFRSPYPDFYATPSLFLSSDKILICPQPLVIVGISPKSYGFFHNNNLTHEGVAFLKNEEELKSDSDVERYRLPGTSYNDSWLLAMQALYLQFGLDRKLTPDYSRYRRLQIMHCVKKHDLDRTLDSTVLKALFDVLNPYERFVFVPALRTVLKFLRLLPADLKETTIAKLRQVAGQHLASNEALPVAGSRTLLDVFEKFVQGGAIAQGASVHG